jgi:hypothetical protein
MGGFTNSPIRQSLSDNASRQLVGAFHIFNAKRGAVRVSKIKFRDVSV